LPSRRPRSLPHLVCTTGGARLGPAAAVPAGPADAFGLSCPRASPATPTTTPPSRAVVPSICRRLIRPSGVFDDSSDIVPPHPLASAVPDHAPMGPISVFCMQSTPRLLRLFQAPVRARSGNMKKNARKDYTRRPEGARRISVRSASRWAGLHACRRDWGRDRRYCGRSKSAVPVGAKYRGCAARRARHGTVTASCCAGVSLAVPTI